MVIAVPPAVKFEVSAWHGRYFTGTISRVSHWVDAKTRTMAVETEVYQGVPIPDPGMFAEVIWPLCGEALSRR